MRMSENDFITIPEACELLKVTRNTLYVWTKQGRVTSYKLAAKAVRYKRSELTQFMEGCKNG